MEKVAERRFPRRKFVVFVLVSVLILLGAAALHFYLRYKETHISTDSAFVDGRVHVIASKISGSVQVLHVRDNQLVRKSDLLLEIDPSDYDVRVREARAGLLTEKARLTEIRSRIDTVKKQLIEIMASSEAARAHLEVQTTNLDLAKADFERSKALMKKEVISRQQYDNARNRYEVAEAQVKAAQEQVRQVDASLETQRALIKQTEAGLPAQEAQIRQKEASLRGAELNLSYTKICAPAGGYITKRTVETGNQVQPAQPLMAIVPLHEDQIWITANYKETELKKVRPGQKVRIKVDTYPGRIFNGKVNSIMAGTGAAFSLFPPENATGNFVKVVQRIPVKITLDEGSDPGHLLRIGMSVVPTILAEQ